MLRLQVVGRLYGTTAVHSIQQLIGPGKGEKTEKAYRGMVQEWTEYSALQYAT